jgi:hypothetical protein
MRASEVTMACTEPRDLSPRPSMPLYRFHLPTASCTAFLKSLTNYAFLFLFAGSFVATLKPESQPVEVQSPFSVSIVVGRPRIAMAKNKPDEIYVVLTNVSGELQAVWESWNSWGYQTISFELTTADGKKFTVTRCQEDFTRNFPSTYVIKPGEHQVFAIRLDEWWETRPSLPKGDEALITLKAIHEVTPTPEATKYKVWTGRVESRSYNCSLRRW